MKTPNAILALLLAVPFQSLHAAYQSMSVKTRQVIYDNGVRRVEVSRPAYGFRVEIISDDEGVKQESARNGRPFVSARADERYAVRLYNPLPVRVAANLTVDGLNSITGKPSGITDGAMWIIEANSFITLRGWQVNGSESRRFFFTPKPKSYAKWTGDRMGKDLAANCGVIGAAYFWSQKELDAYYEANPQYRYSQPVMWESKARLNQPGMFNKGLGQSRSAPMPTADASASAPSEYEDRREKKEVAGTGMGERETNPIQMVELHVDSGMYRVKQAVVIYYDFAQIPPPPNPFPEISYAPEMP